MRIRAPGNDYMRSLTDDNGDVCPMQTHIKNSYTRKTYTHTFTHMHTKTHAFTNAHRDTYTRKYTAIEIHVQLNASMHA